MSHPPQADGQTQARQDRGRQAWHAGQAAEHAVARHYERAGLSIAARRWRKGGGELDLVMRDGDSLVFVEVKKSRDFDRAAASLSARQMARLHDGAALFLAGESLGELTDCRFDVALVNAHGEICIVENAF
ncbi:YraN family protein [Shimia sp. SDUM112013]|uniref:YraN family protein n=1 Tax=Shimia sp. SDUM112013 TaxID=3136160 RepID=UPI0032EB341E